MNIETKTVKPKSKNLFLVEFYTVNGAINFAWIFATDKSEAVKKLQANQGSRFDCVITNEEQSAIVPLGGNFRVNTPDANLFIIQ